MQDPSLIENRFVVRLGILAIGSYSLFACSDLWYRIEPAYFPPSVVLCVPWLCILSGLLLLIWGGTSSRPRRAQPFAFALVLLIHLSAQLVYFLAETRNDKVSDTVLLSLEAATLFLAGENPYGYPMLDVHSAFESTAQAMTPHLDGHLVSVLPYPPLHFLVLAPFLVLELQGPRLLFGICHLGLLALTYRMAPRDFRLLAVLPLLINPEYGSFPLSWGSDSVWVLLLALMIRNWDHQPARATLLGLACAYKQTPWLFAPFLMIKVVKEDGWASGLRLVGISLGIFTIINLPFAWSNWEAWVKGVFNPAVSPMVPYGRGWSLLTQSLAVPFSRTYYTHLFGFVLVTLMLIFWTNFHRLRPALWVLPSIALFFGFRNLQHYFIFSVPLVVLALCCRGKQISETTQPLTKWPFAILLFGLAGLTGIHWPGDSGVAIELQPKASSPAPFLSKMELRVVNNGTAHLVPRFFVRTRWHAYPWQIDSGPRTLNPGQSGLYEISTDMTYRFLFKSEGGAVLLSDANSAERYLSQVVFPRDQALRHPRRLQLPPGSSWVADGNVEIDQGVLRFNCGPSTPYSSLSREITLPDSPVRFKVKLPFSSGPDKSFGLSLRPDRGRAEISVYFGKTESRGYHDSDHFFKVLPTPEGQWVEHELDLKALYIEAGLAPPSLQRVVSNDVEMLARPLILSFDLTSKTENVEAVIRDLQWPDDSALGRVIQNTQRKPEYLPLVGDLALMEGNYERALNHYEAAVELRNPRKVSNREPIWVISQATQVEKTVRGDLELLLLARPTDRLRFVWSPECSFTLSTNDEKKLLNSSNWWSPLTLGVVKVRLSPDQPSILKRIEIGGNQS